jgi:hypothetical protein
MVATESVGALGLRVCPAEPDGRPKVEGIARSEGDLTGLRRNDRDPVPGSYR